MTSKLTSERTNRLLDGPNWRPLDWRGVDWRALDWCSGALRWGMGGLLWWGEGSDLVWLLRGRILGQEMPELVWGANYGDHARRAASLPHSGRPGMAPLAAPMRQLLPDARALRGGTQPATPPATPSGARTPARPDRAPARPKTRPAVQTRDDARHPATPEAPSTPPRDAVPRRAPPERIESVATPEQVELRKPTAEPPAAPARPRQVPAEERPATPPAGRPPTPSAPPVPAAVAADRKGAGAGDPPPRPAAAPATADPVVAEAPVAPEAPTAPAIPAAPAIPSAPSFPRSAAGPPRPGAPAPLAATRSRVPFVGELRTSALDWQPDTLLGVPGEVQQADTFAEIVLPHKPGEAAAPAPSAPTPSPPATRARPTPTAKPAATRPAEARSATAAPTREATPSPVPPAAGTARPDPRPTPSTAPSTPAPATSRPARGPVAPERSAPARGPALKRGAGPLWSGRSTTREEPPAAVQPEEPVVTAPRMAATAPQVESPSGGLERSPLQPQRPPQATPTTLAPALATPDEPALWPGEVTPVSWQQVLGGPTGMSLLQQRTPGAASHAAARPTPDGHAPTPPARPAAPSRPSQPRSALATARADTTPAAPAAGQPAKTAKTAKTAGTAPGPAAPGGAPPDAPRQQATPARPAAPAARQPSTPGAAPPRPTAMAPPRPLAHSGPASPLAAEFRRSTEVLDASPAGPSEMVQASLGPLPRAFVGPAGTEDTSTPIPEVVPETTPAGGPTPAAVQRSPGSTPTTTRPVRPVARRSTPRPATPRPTPRAASALTGTRTDLRSGPELRGGPDMRPMEEIAGEKVLLGEVGQRVLRLLSNAAVQGIHLSRAATGRIEASPVTEQPAEAPPLAPRSTTTPRTPDQAAPTAPATAARAAHAGMPTLLQRGATAPAPSGWSETSEGEGLAPTDTAAPAPAFERGVGTIAQPATPQAPEVFTRPPARTDRVERARTPVPSTAATGRPLQAPGTGRPVSPPSSLRPRDLLAVPAREAVARGTGDHRIADPAESAGEGWQPPEEQLVTMARAIGRVVQQQREEERRAATTTKKRKAPSRPATGAPSFAARSPHRAEGEAMDEDHDVEAASEAPAAPGGAAMSWQAPRRTAQKKTTAAAPPAPRPDTKVLEEMAEEELLQVLRSLTVSSPEARQLLREVQQQIDEYWRIERMRQIS